MNKKAIFAILGVIALAASAGMYIMGKDSHLTELKDFWWMPLPLAVLLFIGAGASKPKE